MMEPTYFLCRKKWNFSHNRSSLYLTSTETKFLSKWKYPANIRLDEDVLKTSWRHLSSVPSEDVLTRTNMFALAFRLQTTSSRRLQDVLIKTNIFDLAIRLQDVFKTSCKSVFKTSSRHLQEVLQRYLQDVFKTYHQVKLFFLTRLWEAFNTFLRRSFSKTVIYRGICLSNITSDKFMVSVPNLQER